jgi:hypothetical protein
MTAGRGAPCFDARWIQVYTTGVLLGKDVRYTPLRGTKAANPGGGIDWINAADLIVGRLAIVIKAAEILEHVYYNFC